MSAAGLSATPNGYRVLAADQRQLLSVIGTLARAFPDRRLGAQGEEFPRQYARVQIVQSARRVT